jgi:hypothetical protein
VVGVAVAVGPPADGVGLAVGVALGGGAAAAPASAASALIRPDSQSVPVPEMWSAVAVIRSETAWGVVP